MNRNRNIAVAATIGALALLLVTIGLMGLTNVDAGERAVVFHRDGSLDILGPGKFQFVMPFFNSVTKYDVRAHLDNAKATAASRDLQEVNVNVAVQYHPDPSHIAWIHQNIGDDYLGKVIQPAVQEAVKASTAQHDAANIIQNRPLIKEQIEQVLRERLEASHIVLDQVSLTNIDFSKQFTQAIEDSQTAKQKIILEQNNLQVARLQANQTIVQATAQAESARLLSQVTQGEQGAAYLYLEWLRKWDGHLPQYMSDDASILLPTPPRGTNP